MKVIEKKFPSKGGPIALRVEIENVDEARPNPGCYVARYYVADEPVHRDDFRAVLALLGGAK